jgi:hypothetical protein
MNEKYDRKMQGGQQGGKQQQHGQGSQGNVQRGDVEKRANYEKGPDQWKRQSEPAQQGGERKSGGRTNQR